MRLSVSALFVLPVFVLCVRSVDAQPPPRLSIKSVPASAVTVSEGLRADRLKVGREVTLPRVLAICRTAGRIENFRIAAGLSRGEQCGQYPFDDTDVYKLIEGASWTLGSHGDRELHRIVRRDTPRRPDFRGAPEQFARHSGGVVFLDEERYRVGRV